MYFNVVRAEDLWTKVELGEVGYVDKAQDFLVIVNTVIDDKEELLKSEL